jgi:hypothetical protein
MTVETPLYMRNNSSTSCSTVQYPCQCLIQHLEWDLLVAKPNIRGEYELCNIQLVVVRPRAEVNRIIAMDYAAIGISKTSSTFI